MRAREILLAAFFASVVVAAASPARAHPILEEAKHLFDEADFEGALAAFTRAEEAGDLTREDLVELLTHRALVHHTLGNQQDLTSDLLRLATLEPDHEFGDEIPPVVRESFERAKAETTGELTVTVTVRQETGGVRLEARVSNDTGALVQEVRIGARAPGNAWTTRSNAPLVMPAPSDTELEFFAVAIGPGGAVVASDGLPEDPVSGVVSELVRRVRTATTARTTRPGPRTSNGHTDPNDGGGGLPAWPFLLGGGLIAAAAAVILVLVFTSQGADTIVTGPGFQSP